MVDEYEDNITYTNAIEDNTTISILHINRATTSHAGFFWINTSKPSNVCNASLTILRSM